MEDQIRPMSTYARLIQVKDEIGDNPVPLINRITEAHWSLISNMPLPGQLSSNSKQEKYYDVPKKYGNILQTRYPDFIFLIKELGVLRSEKFIYKENKKIDYQIVFSEPELYKFWNENFILLLMKKFLASPLCKSPYLNEIIFDMWKSNHRVRDWVFGKSVNFGTTLQPHIRNITTKELISFFEFALSVKELELIMQIWHENQELHNALQLLPLKKKVDVLDQILILNHVPLIKEYIKRVQNIPFLTFISTWLLKSGRSHKNASLLSNICMSEGQHVVIQSLNEYISNNSQDSLMSNEDMDNSEEVEVAKNICISQNLLPLTESDELLDLEIDNDSSNDFSSDYSAYSHVR